MPEESLAQIAESLSNHPLVLAATPKRRLPLTVAVGCDDLDLVEYLIEHDFDPNERNEDGTTALSEVHSVEICRVLFEAGALISEEHPENGQTSVHYSCRMGCLDILRELLAHGGSNVLASFDSMNYAPLHHAARNNHTEIVSLLLEAGADPNLAKVACRTPTQLAVSPYTMDSLKVLFAYGGLLTANDIHDAQATYGKAFAKEVLALHDARFPVPSGDGTPASS